MLRALFKSLVAAVCTRDWSVIDDDDRLDPAIMAIPTSRVVLTDKVIKTDLRKGQAQRLARKLRQQREGRPEPICPPEDVQ